MLTTIRQTHEIVEKLRLEVETSGAEDIPRHASAIVENEMDRIIQEWEDEVERVRTDAQDELKELRSRVSELENENADLASLIHLYEQSGRV